MSGMFMVALVMAQAGAAKGATAANDTAVPAAVDVRNELGKRFKLVEAMLTVDDKEVVDRVAGPGHEMDPSFRLWESGGKRTELRPGMHAVSVTLVYEGRNVGPFSYLSGYHYRVESTLPFEVRDNGDPAVIQVVAHERGGADVPLAQKPVLSIQPGPGSSAVPAVAQPDGIPAPSPSAEP